MRKYITVVLSLPINLVETIESTRNDLPRSLFYRRLIIKGLGKQNE